ncbi:sulfite exporter TauE/SafE family protein [Desulfatiferula olefinivorans]
MTVFAVAGFITLFFTTLLTIAGVGAAFILIPVFMTMGIDLHVAMATALLLNAIAMMFASYRFYKKDLILWSVAIPILFVATPLSPLGAFVSKGLDRSLLLWLFVAFLVFAAGMMLFYKPKPQKNQATKTRQLVYGCGIGAFAGFLGGLLGVGGGNFIVPVLIGLGVDPKKASATTSFIVIFSSLSGFLGHATIGNISAPLLGFTALGSALGAVVGAWLMTDKLNQTQVKRMVGVVLLLIAGKMMWSLLFQA